MNYFFSILAGIIQGLTEFLPISSSGHLILIHEILGFNFADNLAYDVILHLGTMAAILAFFWRDLFKYLIAGLKSFIKPDLKNDRNQLMAWLILIAAIPAGVAGLVFEERFEAMFRQPLTVALMLIIIGLIMYFVEKFSKKNKPLDKSNFFDALIIGFAQILSLAPGVSRSGITIIAGLGRNLNRKDAAYFSFLVSAPLVLAAGLKKTLDLWQLNLSGVDLLVLFLGFITSALTGYLCIKYFLKYLERHTLQIFAYYRIILGVLVILYLIFI